MLIYQEVMSPAECFWRAILNVVILFILFAVQRADLVIWLLPTQRTGFAVLSIFIDFYRFEYLYRPAGESALAICATEALSSCLSRDFIGFTCISPLSCILARMSSTATVVQSNVPKLEGKKNYRTWNLRIRPLLGSRGELAAIEYTPQLKKSSNKKDIKDTIAAALAAVEQL